MCVIQKRTYLQHEPQLVPTFLVLFVIHPEELDNISVVRQGFENVVFCFNFFINILQSKGKRKVVLLYKTVLTLLFVGKLNYRRRLTCCFLIEGWFFLELYMK